MPHRAAVVVVRGFAGVPANIRRDKYLRLEASSLLALLPQSLQIPGVKTDRPIAVVIRHLAAAVISRALNVLPAPILRKIPDASTPSIQ